MMTNLEIVKKAIAETLEYAGADNYSTYREMIVEEYDGQYGDFKRDVLYTIDTICNDLVVEPAIQDDGSIELEDGTFTTYVKVLNEVKKSFF